MLPGRTAHIVIPRIAKLQHFARFFGVGRKSHGPAKPSDLQLLPEHIITPETAGREIIGPYDRAFQQHLIDYGIFPHAYEFPDGQLLPKLENKGDILRSLVQSRASLAHFSNHDFRKFELAEAQAIRERDITTSVIPIIEGDIGDRKCLAGKIPFTNLEHLTDGTLVPANPDIFYGARPEQLHPQIRKELNSRVVPSTQSELPIAPNFFVEVKGKDGSATVTQQQLFYDMALGERGQQALRSRNPFYASYDNKSHTLGYLYLDGQLKIYATHAIQPSSPAGQPGFVVTQLGAFALTNDVDTFRRGAAAYRNGRDWAKKQRNDAIEQANEMLSWDEGVKFRPALTLPRLKHFWFAAVSRWQRRE
ncbi:hypothetical protein M441DRAFT_28232 [Trichoderma asperellum CBS 433.97]|uniref:Uncharacterized protein n=1 Tax=Trichoderma asperellum (strain ATCC 204424 / CBS 433.97 / NBRC 101777) TaxID=1042311 RepID=A0A2T3Z6G8_TRIA4|nr:hypothetical protein M441DRAFT_28232 [Trichoderma asperellum CBS 433.97]PTB40416.1 hypothetical protein M441DRAFT_28232 [Trichoderma asperellum CBS 433.97]